MRYLLGIFTQAETTSLAVDIGCADAVAWAMDDTQYTAMKNGACTYSNGVLTGCETYYAPVKAGSSLHIDIPSDNGPGDNLNYVLYNPTASACTITRGHWHSTEPRDSTTLTTVLIVVGAFCGLGCVCTAILAAFKWRQNAQVQTPALPLSPQDSSKLEA